jgi:hypothetical protein
MGQTNVTPQLLGFRGSHRPSAENEVQNQGNDCEDQQQVDQSPGHVKHREASKPRDQQNDKQHCPDAHVLSFVSGEPVALARILNRRAARIQLSHYSPAVAVSVTKTLYLFGIESVPRLR